MKKVVLLKGQSNYNVLRYWMDALARGLEKKGIETIVLDGNYSVNDQVITLLSLDVDAVISFNGLYLENKEIIEKVIKAPYIYLLIDHPIDHLGRLENLRPQDILTVIDRNDENILGYFGLNISNTYMLPHAAIELSVEPVEKTIDILVSGTYSDMTMYTKYIESQPPAIFAICKEVIDNCLEDSKKYYIDEFLQAFAKRGVLIDLRLNENPDIIKLVREIGRYIYSVNRLSVVTALADAGLPISIYGKGWEDSPLRDYPNVSIHKSVNYWETQELMRHAKVIMSFQALLRDGTHERIFAGMAARSVVLTNETPYLRELFTEKELMFYNFNDLGAMVETVQDILNDDDQREKMSEAAWRAIKGKHTFEERAQMIIDIFNDVEVYK